MTLRTADEETPLLEQRKKAPTPLPWSQFSVVLFQQLAEPLALNVVSPFAPQVCVYNLIKTRLMVVSLSVTWALRMGGRAKWGTMSV